MQDPGSDHTITISKNPHRIRVMLGGFIVAETTSALALVEGQHPPVQYIPREDVRMDLLERTSRTTQCPHKGEASFFRVTAGGLVRPDAAWSYENPLPASEQIRGYIAFQPDRVDAIEEFSD
ncbi:DUF427 domain-containing protein [Microvirga massiliensis]|uniref:DUF427 domain-containing protein n=1 Tax=Microvirga massiliensis TaxID=1033741 RepID=UPI00062B764A|nr:DUF427 domain-containing protein [Microvirga massiliensis]